MDKELTKNYNILIVVFVLFLIYLAAVTLPVSSSKKDIYIDLSLYQPGTDITWSGLVAPPLEITNIDATIKTSTLLSTPTFLANILYSGNIKVVASTQSISSVATTEPVLVWTSRGIRIILKDVPISENTVSIKLYNDNNLIQTKVVTLI